MNVIKWLLSDPWIAIMFICILIMPTWYMERMHIDDSITHYFVEKHERRNKC